MGLTRPKVARASLLWLRRSHLTDSCWIVDTSGGFSRFTLDTWPSCKRFYLVDIWRHQPNYKDIANVDNAEQDKLYNQAMETLAPYK